MQHRLNKRNSVGYHQQGAALITALFIMAIVAFVAVIMALQQSIQIRRTHTLIASDEATLDAESVSAWAQGLLIDNAVNSTNNSVVDDLPQRFNLKTKSTMIHGELIDMQSRFNLNNITDNRNMKGFARLIMSAIPEIKEDLALQIATATKEWVTKTDPHAETKADITIDPSYLTYSPPYRAPQYPMASPSEFRLVKGVTAEIYQQLAPYITALPGRTAINVNTASAIVLSTLGNIGLKNAMAIVDSRSHELFQTTKDFMNHAKIASADINEKEITTLSQYFLSSARVQYDTHSIVIYNLLKREIKQNGNQKSAKVSTLWSSQGAW